MVCFNAAVCGETVTEGWCRRDERWLVYCCEKATINILIPWLMHINRQKLFTPNIQYFLFLKINIPRPCGRALQGCRQKIRLEEQLSLRLQNSGSSPATQTQIHYLTSLDSVQINRPIRSFVSMTEGRFSGVRTFNSSLTSTTWNVCVHRNTDSNRTGKDLCWQKMSFKVSFGTIFPFRRGSEVKTDRCGIDQGFHWHGREWLVQHWMVTSSWH